eukprot:TRINITY_DN5574_c0_g1_i4.p1 TRINITY_DN5574_c0_g1~~TRINITY_DN5574_c0_g1_i4.p1  ORF type:complete len:1004 (+),score=184.27 TRINITY_DN5574_c0_g1_i4:103-3114(+)
MRHSYLLRGALFACQEGFFADAYDCSLPGLSTLTPGMYAGQEVNYLSAVTDTSSPQFRVRAKEFEECTGGKINFAEANNVFEDPIKDVGTKMATGLELYDGYLMSYSHFPEASALGLAETLNDRIAASNGRLKWEDFFEQVQQQGQYRRNGQDDIDFLMFDGDFFVPIVRIDLLQKYNLPVPNTWDEVLEQAKFFEGKDLNDDGEPDFGFCFFPRGGMESAWDWWWAEVIYSTWATMAQTSTKKGFFFDTETFKPAMDNEAFRESARIWKQLWSIGVDGCPGHMATGRCAIGYSPPGCWKGVFLDQVARKDVNNSIIWQPTMADGSYAAPYRALTFGSLKVLNAKGQLETCTANSCPLAQHVHTHGHVANRPDRASVLPPSPHAGKLINRAPFYWSGGFGTMIRKSADETRKNVIWDFFVYINDPDTSVMDVSTYASWIDSWRRSQLSLEGTNFIVKSTWSPDTYAEHRSVMISSLSAKCNGALNLRIPGIKEYTHEALGGYMLLYIRNEISEDQLVQQVSQRWREISSTRGLIDQLQIYRATLGREQLSDYELCQLHRDVMDTQDPRICRQFDPADSDGAVAELVLTILGIVAGAALLVAMIGWVIRTFLQKRRLQQKEEQRQWQLIAEALATMKDMRFPMVVLPICVFAELNRFVAHESIRDWSSRALTFLDTPAEIISFMGVNFVIFLSHQWLSWSEPDPNGTQYRCAVRAVQQCIESKGWDYQKCFVWCDIFSIPQKNKAQQASAISSLPVFASSAHAFIVVAPDSEHQHTNQLCGVNTYKDRAWCRAELLSHSLANGVENMYIATNEGELNTVKLDSAMMSASLYVFEGDLTCCRILHEGMVMCDRERLMVPFLCLYGMQHILKTLGAPKEQGDGMDEFLARIQAEVKRMFPDYISVALKDKVETRMLFNGILEKMEKHVEGLTEAELTAIGFTVTTAGHLPLEESGSRSIQVIRSIRPLSNSSTSQERDSDTWSTEEQPKNEEEQKIVSDGVICEVF